VTREVTERGTVWRRGQGIGRAALMIGVITVLARLVGFGRQVVFAHTVGTTCLGTAYTTANMVPNIIYDIVLGGALSSVVVPVLAGPASGEAASRESARRIASALLTWTVLLLVPVSAVLALAAHPLVTALLSGATGCPHGALAGVGARMLLVFAPQVLLYGLAVVLYGILQSHRRFGAPALAPLLSSLVVIGAYAGFGAVGGAYVNRLAELPPLAEYLLSGGTTLGVLALVLTAVVPAWRLGICTSPTLRFPDGVGPRVRRLALAGVITLVAQDASVAAVIVLANRYGDRGALVIYGFAWAVFVVPYAVLAVPIATSAFPELSAAAAASAAGAVPAATATARAGCAATPATPAASAARSRAQDGGYLHADPDQRSPSGSHPGTRLPVDGGVNAMKGIGDIEEISVISYVSASGSAEADGRSGGRFDGRFDGTAAASTRAVVVASWLGAAVLIGARLPLARVFESRSAPGVAVLALALAAFAPGLVGYGLSANLSRVLYAHRRNRAPALATAGGWLLVIVADALIVPFVPAARVVPALGLGTTFGLTVSGVALLVLVRRERGAAALRGVSRAFAAGFAGCVAGAAAGSAAASVLPAAFGRSDGSGFVLNIVISLLVTLVVAGVFAAVVLRLDSGDLRIALSRLRTPRG
jgi:peptidoglycan biosynthesis protein MviN/MurJ (putative lipid II flippase)